MAANLEIDARQGYITAAKLQQVTSTIEDLMSRNNVLLVIRGLPGSGKTYLGQQLSERYQGLQFESDSNFMIAGEYHFDVAKLGASHELCLSSATQAMQAAAPLVAVTNTFTRHWEYAAYLAAAAEHSYSTVIVDLYQHALDNLRACYSTSSAAAVQEAYTSSLYLANSHEVPRDKIAEMGGRYEFGAADVVAQEAVERRRLLAATPEGVRVLDTSYYLCLDIPPAGRADNQHGPLFLACLHGSSDLLRTVGGPSGYAMIRSTLSRNQRSLSQAQARSRASSSLSPHQKQRHPPAAAAVSGWARFHITVLSPAEYEQLMAQGGGRGVEAMLTAVQALPLDQLLRPYLPLADDPSSEGYAEALALVHRQMGMVQGPITEGSTPSAVPRLSPEVAKVLDASRLSTAFYLSLPVEGVLADIAAIRRRFGVLGPWSPHITLGFTHNDVHTADRAAGLTAYASLRTSCCTSSSSNVSTDLPLDEQPHSLFAELALHSETQTTFSAAHGLTVCDVKVRRGAFGDDLTYKTHSVLLRLLPRGLVFVQTADGLLRRGLHSLSKFFGKEGMEDDGAGLSVQELNLRLQSTLTAAEELVVMEKVNGRAASARFFVLGGHPYVIIGTKLAHTIGLLDVPSRRIVLEDDYYKSSAHAEDSDEDSSTSYVVQRGALILSNTQALEASIVWEQAHTLAGWLAGRTLNGEVLDPEDMHLVPVDQLRWVFLCCTSFPQHDHDHHEEYIKSSLLEELGRAAAHLLHLPPYLRLPLDPAASALSKRAAAMAPTKDIVRATQSEGKVLYLLDGAGGVLEMIKYKTWWYIYRRAVRELAAKALSRYLRKDKDIVSRDRKAAQQAAAEHKKNAAVLEKMRSNLPHLLRAAGKEEAVQALRDKIFAMEARLGMHPHPQTQAEGDRALKMKSIVDELEQEVARKWRSKFAFMKEDLGAGDGEDGYEQQVAQVMGLAVGFLRFFAQGLLSSEAETVKRFKRYYPLYWEDFMRSRTDTTSSS